MVMWMFGWLSITLRLPLILPSPKRVKEIQREAENRVRVRVGGWKEGEGKLQEFY